MQVTGTRCAGPRSEYKRRVAGASSESKGRVPFEAFEQVSGIPDGIDKRVVSFTSSLNDVGDVLRMMVQQGYRKGGYRA